MSPGKPLTAFAANPVYQNGGEIPLTPRGDGFSTSQGFRTSTPFTTLADGHASYPVPLGGRRRLALVGDVFNIFNTQTLSDYNNFVETTPGPLNPDFAVPEASSVVA